MAPRFLLSAALLLTVLLTPAVALAQNTTIQKKTSGRTTTPSVTPITQGVIIRNGVAVEVNGKTYTPLTSARTYRNGAVLQPSGALKLPGGETVQLNEGDRIDLKGNLTRSPVVVERSTTMTGDTTGIGNQLMQAQQHRERQKLLQEKARLLEEKSKILEKTARTKPDAAVLKKLDADMVKVQQQIDAENKKGQ